MNDQIYYVSQEGLEQLQNELAYREGELRREIADRIGTAKDHGDLSENFEYHDAKERQAENETRIIQLRDMLSKSKLIEKRGGEDEIHLGNSFTVEMEDGSEKDFELVGATETDPMAGKISNDSPIGQAFVGKKVGDIVEITVPSGTITYKVKRIH